MAKSNPLAPLVRRYVETDPEGMARMLEAMSEEDVVEAMKELPHAVVARAFPFLQAGYAAALLATAEPDLFKAVAKRLDPKRAAKIFTRLPAEVRESLVPHIPDKVRAQVRELLTYPESSVGQMMSANYLTVPVTGTVRSAIDKIRRLAQRGTPASYAYVVDGEERLVGILSTYDLILASPSQKIGSIMRGDVFTIDPFMEQNQAAEALSKRRYFAAPVVDSQRHLLGVVKAEQLIEGVKSEVAQDLQKMFGVGAEERAFSSLGYSLRKRLPWLHVNLITAFAAAAVVALFEGIIAKVTALAVFLPVVAGQGGNAGAQSLAIVMRGLVMREIPRDRIRPLILKETVLGAITGAATGIVTAIVAWLWMGNAALGLVIGMGMIVNLACAGLAGASIPILLKKFGLDPAQSSSIMLTTVTDVVGFFAFLGFAVLMQNHLM